MNQAPTQVVVLGTGIMASGIAAGFIAAGTPVVILGRTLVKAQDCAKLAQELASTLSKNKHPAPTTALIHSYTDWSKATWIIESVTEDLELKQELFKKLDAEVPDHIPIGSNSSGFPITKIAAHLKTRHRMFNAHYFMPAHLVPLVEIALGEDSDPAMAQQVCDLYRLVGKKPVLVKRDIPGFLANRIQHALMREALALIDQGIATPDDVDTAVRYSFGFRYAAAGPILQKEISGWDTMAHAAQEIYPSLSNQHQMANCIEELMKKGHTGMKSGAGFKQWTKEQITEERKNYNDRLKAAFDILQMK